MYEGYIGLYRQTYEGEKEMKSYSFSKIDQYMRCPLAYKKINLDHETLTDKGSMIQGKIAHKILELGSKVKNPYLISNLILKDKDSDLHDPLLINEIMEGIKHLLSDEFYEGIQSAELFITFQIWPYEIRGIIDRLDKSDHYKIVDYKYGNYEYTKDNIDQSLQLSLYAYYIMMRYSVSEVEVEYVNIKQGTRVSRIIHSGDFDPEKIKSLISAIEFSELLDLFPPHLSGGCINCGVRMSCSPFRQWIQNSLPESPEPDISLEGLLLHYYEVQEKERLLKKQRMKLQPILTEIMKSQGSQISGFSIEYGKYGNMELKKS